MEHFDTSLFPIFHSQWKKVGLIHWMMGEHLES